MSETGRSDSFAVDDNPTSFQQWWTADSHQNAPNDHKPRLREHFQQQMDAAMAIAKMAFAAGRASVQHDVDWLERLNDTALERLPQPPNRDSDSFGDVTCIRISDKNLRLTTIWLDAAGHYRSFPIDFVRLDDGAQLCITVDNNELGEMRVPAASADLVP